MTMVVRLPLFLLVLSVSYSHKVLLIGPAYLSSSSLLDFARVLSGHELHYLNVHNSVVFQSPPQHDHIHSYHQSVPSDKAELAACLPEAIKRARSDRMMLDTIIICKENILATLDEYKETILGDKVASLMQKEHFDLIISDGDLLDPAAILAKRHHIPLVAYLPQFSNIMQLTSSNIPYLPVSQPNIFKETISPQPPTFRQRLRSLKLMLKYYIGFKIDYWRTYSGIVEDPEEHDKIQLKLVNDHISYSYPYLLSPADIPVGASYLSRGNPLGGKPLPSDLFSFMLETTSNVFISFSVPATYVPWYDDIIKVILGMENVNIVVNMYNSDEKDLFEGYPKDRVYTTTIPHRDVLSGELIDVFVTDCEQDARLQATFYHTPMLCIPLFGNQYLSSQMVKYQGVGEVLTKEQFSDLELLKALNTMLNSTNYQNYLSKYRTVTQLYESDAGVQNGTQARNLIDILVRRGNLDHIHNAMLDQQYRYEIYNFDIILFMSGIGVLIVGTAVYLIVICILGLHNWMKRKLLACKRKVE